MASKFPSTLYVRHEDDNDGGYLVADSALPSVEETTPVAVYKLVEVGAVEVTRQYAKKASRR